MRPSIRRDLVDPQSEAYKLGIGRETELSAIVIGVIWSVFYILVVI